MSGMEFMAEAMELAEGTEMSELLEQRDALQGQLEAAQKAGNTEKANFFRGELAKLDEQLAQQAESADGIGGGQEISFGKGYSGGHSESYWKDKAAEEYAKNGESAYYKKCLKHAGEAHVESLY